jgi:hypothetical protein
MRRRSRFAQILDEKLCAPQRTEAHRHQPQSRSAQGMLPHPFLFAAPYRVFKASAYLQHSECAAAPRRALAAHEHAALLALNHFGARLTADFTAHDLRRAFRGLARQYHPDRHPLCDQAEKAQLARVFSEIVAHHRQLTRVALPCPG